MRHGMSRSWMPLNNGVKLLGHSSWKWLGSHLIKANGAKGCNWA
ncbi:hypothetical protein HanIR_Chr11g0554431 [Helianthus annuus]|nr:hypothetical protein HanIR_Chr11g0554431 [Helianthus annuus]